MNEKQNEKQSEIQLLQEKLTELELVLGHYREARTRLADMVTETNGIVGRVLELQKQVDSLINNVKGNSHVSSIGDMIDKSEGWEDKIYQEAKKDFQKLTI